MKKSLVILAAGIGSRFGKGIKQLEPIGPNNELIIDYSIHDAIAAGFNRIVFIIRNDIYQEFRERIGERIEKICKPLNVDVVYAFQEKEMFVDSIPTGRTKPWGTGHAILCASEYIDSSFVVINSDDYYGKEGFNKALQFNSNEYALIGYRLKNTLSDNGGVTRGICTVADGKLIGITETKNIIKTENEVISGTGKILDTESLVSMNFWCFPRSFINILQEGFSSFYVNMKDNQNDEYLLPIIADDMIKNGVKFSVLPSNDRWYGLTYQDDKESVIRNFRKLYDIGVYKEDLYSDLF